MHAGYLAHHIHTHTPVAGVVFVPGRPMLSKPQGVFIEIELIPCISRIFNDEAPHNLLRQYIKQHVCMCKPKQTHCFISSPARPKTSSWDALETFVHLNASEPQSCQLVPKVRVQLLSNWTMLKRPCHVRRPAGWRARRQHCLAGWSFG